MTRGIPDLLLERYRLDELPAAVHATIAREAAADALVRARLNDLAASDAEILERYPAGVLTRRRLPPSRRMPIVMLAGALTAAVIALVVAVPRTIVPAVDEGTRIKGGSGRPALAVYRRTAAGSERLADGDVARAGDLLRIGY